MRPTTTRMVLVVAALLVAATTLPRLLPGMSQALTGGGAWPLGLVILLPAVLWPFRRVRLPVRIRAGRAAHGPLEEAARRSGLAQDAVRMLRNVPGSSCRPGKVVRLAGPGRGAGRNPQAVVTSSLNKTISTMRQAAYRLPFRAPTSSGPES